MVDHLCCYAIMYVQQKGKDTNMDKEYRTIEFYARREGYRAYLNGLSQADNPYNNNEEWDLHLAWDEGWNNASWDD